MKGKRKDTIYCDYASGAPVDPAVIKVMEAVLPLAANPSAIHQEGVMLRTMMEDARASIARLLFAHPDEIIFTGSGTESINLAIRGVIAQAKKSMQKKPHVITTAIEHSAVLEPLRSLVKDGLIYCDEIPVNHSGILDCAALKKAIREETVLVAVMAINNEIGAIEPIRDVTKIVRDWKKSRAQNGSAYPYVFTDACQAFSTLPIHVERWGIDLLAMNGTKIHGPKGIGLLYIRRGVSMDPILVGGGQERGFRAGTENVPAILGMAKAMEVAEKVREKEASRLLLLRDELWKKIQAIDQRIHANGDLRDRAPGNLNITVPEADHQYLALALDREGILCGTKSACRANDDGDSHVLQALRLSGDAPELPAQGIRLSLGRGTKKKDIERMISALQKTIPLARASKTIKSQ